MTRLFFSPFSVKKPPLSGAYSFFFFPLDCRDFPLPLSKSTKSQPGRFARLALFFLSSSIPSAWTSPSPLPLLYRVRSWVDPKEPLLA